jgi:N-acetyl sugar amidotransferase
LNNIQICTACVMDTSDPQITFDESGVCDHCISFKDNIAPNWHTDERGNKKFLNIVNAIKDEGEGKQFDCIMGMSGGLDSSYLLHVAVKKYGLRPLVFHVDAGWNSQMAVNNIEVMVDKLGLDLYTEVINWEEMKDFQLSFFKSGVPHLDVPQDHSFIATLYHFANKHKIKYILNGGNFSTECVRNPLDWLYYGSDTAQIKDIHGQFGTKKLKTYPITNVLWHKIYLRYFKGIKVIKPLNFFPYIKQQAIDTLVREYDWQVYPQKHFESRFTKFFEGYWLPTRFGYDTRKVQYSSLIQTKQMTREEAISKLEELPYKKDEISHDFEYIATKLGIDVDELRKYHVMPKKSYKDYKSHQPLFNLGAKALHWLGIEKAIKR